MALLDNSPHRIVPAAYPHSREYLLHSATRHFPSPLFRENLPPQGQDSAAESHFADLVSSAEDAIVTKDLGGIVQSWNPAATRVFGYSESEIVGRSILAVIPPDLHREEKAILQHISSGHRIENFETRRIRKNGEEFIASVTISPVKNSRGQVIGASKVIRDVTEARRVEQVQLRNEKLAAATRMATVIAHQINNPLEALVNLVYLVQQRCAGDEEASLYLNLAQQELRRICHMAQQPMTLFNPPAVEPLHHSGDLVSYVLSIYESRLQSSNIRVETDLKATRQIALRRGEMLQIVSTAVVNAIDAMPFGGRLIISSRDLDLSSREGVEVVIRDTGIGIAPEHKNKLFEPFFTTKGILGSGTSLWTAKQFIEKHGGKISIESSTEIGSTGTTLTIFLPLQS